MTNLLMRNEHYLFPSMIDIIRQGFIFQKRYIRPGPILGRFSLEFIRNKYFMYQPHHLRNNNFCSEDANGQSPRFD